MILQSLYKDADAIMTQTGLGKMPPSMYIPKLLRWVVELSTDPNTPVQFSPQTVTDAKGKEKGIQHLLPDVKRSGIKPPPLLLADTPSYALGLVFESDLKGKDAAQLRMQAVRKHEDFKDLVKRCADMTEDADVAAISRFLDTWDPEHLPPDFPKDMDGSQTVTFRVDRHPLVIEDLQVRAFWAAHVAGDDTGVAEDRPPMQCLVSGVRGPVEKIMPVAVKGIPGGQAMGTHLVSANFNAVESYGLERAQTSPISREAGERFGKALNALLASDRHHLTVQNMVYVYWAAPGTPKLLPFALSPSTEEVKGLFEAVHKGEPWCNIPNDSKFHIFGLSANAARAVVRSEIDTTIKKVGEAQAAWFRRLQVVGPDGQQWRPLSIKGPHGLAVAPYRDFKDISPSVEDALVQAALNSDHARLPESLLNAVVMRCRFGTKVGDRVTHVTYARAALLKYMITQHLSLEETDRMSTLNQDETETAYLCGRLLAQLEYIQYRSRGKANPANATLVDRFYGGASTTPRTVFPPLLRMATQAHLPQIRRESGSGIYLSLKNALGEIAGKIGTDFPLHLTVRQQGQFALGYYFQSAYRPNSSVPAPNEMASRTEVEDGKAHDN